MYAARLAVAAVSCSMIVACSGDPDGNNTNGMSNNSNGSTNNVASNNSNNSNNQNVVDNNSTNNTTTPNNTIAGPEGRALAVTSDFATGMSAWHLAALSELGVADYPIGNGDVAIARGSQHAYVLDRNNSQVQVIDAVTLDDLGIIDVAGAAPSNPNDATDAMGKTYISLYNTGELAVATPNGADWDVSRISLATYDDYDQNPEPSAMHTDGDFVLVVLQRLQDFAPVEDSMLVVVDAGDDSVADALNLGVFNAQAGLRPVGSSFAVGATGDYGANDGGILALTRTAAGDYGVGDLLVTEDELGGDLLDFVFVTETRGFAVITLPDFSSKLLEFEVGGDVNPVDTVAAPGFAGLDVSFDGRWLAVGDRAPEVNAFLLFDLEDALDSSHVLSTTLPPSGFRFLP